MYGKQGEDDGEGDRHDQRDQVRRVGLQTLDCRQDGDGWGNRAVAIQQQFTNEPCN